MSGRSLMVAVGGLALLFLVLGRLAGNGAPPGDISAASGDGATRGATESARPAQVDYVRWEQPGGLFAAEVPRGWRIDGEIGPAPDQGQFKINGFSPDGSMLFSLGHNWLSFMEFQVGPYRPGHETVEALVLPSFLQQQPGYATAHVVYRSANRRIAVADPTTGLAIPFDTGSLGFLLRTTGGGFAAGTALGETMYIATPGTPGLWRLRLFAAVVAPADATSQATARAVFDHVRASLELSPDFFALWHRAFDQTARQMRSYSDSMDRFFSRYLESAGRSSGGPERDPLEGWAAMMRGGDYASDETTGEQYWVTNDYDNWWVDDSGTVVGTDTTDPPTADPSWRSLPRPRR